jgi:hypothetical protein
VFVLSPDSAASEVCAKEIAFAASLNKRLAPIVARRVDDKAVPEVLRRLNFIFFDDATQFDDKLAQLRADGRHHDARELFALTLRTTTLFPC